MIGGEEKPFCDLVYYWIYSFCIWCLLYQRTPRPTLSLTPGISWLPSCAFQSPIMKRTSFLGVSSRRSCRSSWNHSTSASSEILVGHSLGLLWYWMVCLGNEQRSLCRFEIASKYCTSDSFVDYEGYSISPKGFLPTVVDIMVIWVKFTHSREWSREFQKNIYCCFTDYTKAFDCVDDNKLENSERDGNAKPPDLPPEKSVCRTRSNN